MTWAKTIKEKKSMRILFKTTFCWRTHNNGKILALFITRKSNTILLSEPVVNDLLLCDLKGIVSGEHKDICSVINVSKPEKPLSFRQFRKVHTKDQSFDPNKWLIFWKIRWHNPRRPRTLLFNRAVETNAPLLK